MAGDEESAKTAGQPGTSPGDEASVDVAQLAQKVYRLLHEALRLEQARGANSFKMRGR